MLKNDLNTKSQNHCQVCGEKFEGKDLYPTGLIRSTVINIASKKYPNLNKDGFVCFPDLRKVSAMHFEEILKQEKGELSELEKEVLESLKKHELLSENVHEQYEEELTIGGRLADTIARFGGSWTFIIIFAIVLFSWMIINSVQLLNEPFDPYPFIFLNLILSCLAAVQAPVIMMSQNRQAFKDRLSQENDYQTNLKAELQIRQLNTRLELFMRHHWQKMHEMTRVQEEILQEFEDKNSK